MTSDRNHTAPPLPVDGRGAMALALEQTHDVKEKVELCADSLGSSNDIAKKSIAEGTNPLSARESLANNERVLLSLSTWETCNLSSRRASASPFILTTALPENN
jgi:hypothetical protein